MIVCPKDGKELGKIVGKALYLPSLIEGDVSGHYVSGQDFSVVIKCKCGEVVNVTYEKGEFSYDRSKDDGRHEARPTDGGGTGTRPQVGGSESGKTGSTVEGEGKGTGSTTIPPRPANWIRGK